MSLTNNAQINQQMIKDGLTQFVGAYLTQSDLKPEYARHTAVALLMEEALSLAYIDGAYNDYVMKPVLRAVFNYLLDLQKDIDELLKDANINLYPKSSINTLVAKKNHISFMLQCFKQLIDTSKPKEG